MKVVLLFLVVILVRSGLFGSGNIPDALRCGTDGDKGAIYFAHALSESNCFAYCQVYANENRCVVFNTDGSYRRGQGHYDSRKGCENKSLNQLKVEKRTFQITNQTENLERFAKIEKQIAESIKIQSDYEKIIKLQAQKIEKIEKDIAQLKNNEVLRLKQKAKQMEKEAERKREDTQRMQKVEKAISDFKKETDQKIQKLQNSIKDTKRDEIQRLEKLQKKAYNVKLDDIQLKIANLQYNWNLTNNNVLETRVSKLQKQVKANKLQMLQKILLLESEVNDYFKDEKVKPQKDDIQTKPPSYLQQQSIYQNGQNKPKP